jgi:hypothetical protein
MLVTGGLGGLGLIASYHCAAEFENPIITTSRSGRLPPNCSPHSMLVYEAMQETVPVFNVQCDVGNSKALADLFAWLSRPNMPFDERSMMIDDILKQLKSRMHTLPDAALAPIQDFLFELQDKLVEVISDLMARETKIDRKILTELQEKSSNVADMISRLSTRVGNVRLGRCQLVGGVPPPAYTVPADGWAGQQPQRDFPPQHRLPPQGGARGLRAPGPRGIRAPPPAFGQQALSHLVSDMQDSNMLERG